VAYGQTTNLLLPLGFSIAYAVLLQAELLLTGRHRRLAGAAAILANTLLTLSLLYGLQDHSQHLRGAAMLALAAACFGAGMVIRRSREELSYAYRIQAALLVLVAVPVGLTGGAITLAWAGLSLAYVILGNRLGSDIGRRFGVVAWVLAALYVGFDYDTRLLWLDLPGYAWQALAMAVVGHVLSYLLRDRLVRERTTVDILSSLMFVAAAIGAMSTWHATAAILAYAWALFIAGRVLGRDVWEVQAAGLLVLALAKWGSVDMLATRLAPTATVSKYLPVLNPIMAVGTALAGSIVGMYAMQRQQLEERLAAWAGSLAITVATLIVVIMTFGLSVEVMHVARQARVDPGLGWSMLWTAAVAVQLGLILKLVPTGQTRRDWITFATCCSAIVAIRFLLLDVSQWWLSSRGVVMPLVNLQMLATCVVVAGLGLTWWVRDRQNLSWKFGGVLAIAILLIAGSVEIDRSLADPFARQVAISIYWAVFGVGAIVAGFRLHIAGLRYAGLALLAIALMKVVLIDLRELAQGYRILSFLGLGGLLLATSVVYGKLSPILLRKEVAAVPS
jgi:hypothetical protein